MVLPTLLSPGFADWDRNHVCSNPEEQNHLDVARYHPPAVRDAINELLVAKERLAAAASAAWFSFLKNDFGVQHYAQLKVWHIAIILCGGGTRWRASACICICASVQVCDKRRSRQLRSNWCECKA
eukprot:515014-Pelagomonas_calceolata.AAC.12